MILPAIRDGLKSALETIEGLRAFDNMPQSIPEAPAAYVIPVIGKYHVTMAGNLRCEFNITLVVSLKPSFAEAQELLDQFISPTGDRSIMVAIESDQTLGGVSEIATVHEFTDYGFVVFSGVQFLGCRFRVEIY